MGERAPSKGCVPLLQSLDTPCCVGLRHTADVWSDINPWITEQKTSFTELGTYCTHIFKVIFSTFFFKVRVIGSIEIKTLLFLDFSFFLQLYRVKRLKCLRIRKYNLEHKCELNLSLVWLFLAIVTFYLNCLDRVVLAHPFWALATFTVCFLSLAFGHTEHLPSVQNGPVGFKKTYHA